MYSDKSEIPEEWLKLWSNPNWENSPCLNLYIRDTK